MLADLCSALAILMLAVVILLGAALLAGYVPAACLTNRPYDCAPARVTRVDFSVCIAIRQRNSCCLVAMCQQHRALALSAQTFNDAGQKS
jgi:hypothetical protein